MKKILLILLLVTSTILVAQNNFYVNSSTGSNSNNGTSPSTAWKTLVYADAHFTLGTPSTSSCGSSYWVGEASVAVCIHVAAGQYIGGSSGQTGFVRTTHQGSAGPPVARVVWISDTKRGAILPDLVSTDAVIWYPTAGYVTFIGFSLSSVSGNAHGAHAGWDTNDSVGFTHWYYNYAHDITQWDNNNNADCGQSGGGGIETINRVPGLIVNNNEVARIGIPGSGCNHNHGIYVYGLNSIIQNNLIYQIACSGIANSHPGDPDGAINGSVIANNTIFRTSGPIDGGAATCAAITTGNNSNITIANNVIYDTGAPGGHGAIYAITGLNGARIANNLWKQDTNGAGGQPPDNTGFVTGALTNVTQVGNINVGPQFVNFQGDGSGDYHPATGSPLIHGGTTTCSSGAASPCIPAIDFNGVPQSSPPTIGALVSTTVTSPGVSLNPVSLAYGNVTTNTTVTKTSLLTNTGNASLIISGIVNADSVNYTLTHNCPISPSSLPAGAQCTLTIAFTPKTAASFSNTISVNDNASGSPHIVSITGAGITPLVGHLTLNPTSLAYGNVTINTQQNQAFKISSDGTGPVTINSIVSSDTTHFIIGANNCPGTLAAGANCTMTIGFLPTAVIAYTGTITVNNVTSQPALTVALSGAGVAIATPLLVVSPSSFDFGNVFLGNTTTQNFNLANQGNAPLNISSIAQSGGNTGQYSIVNNPCNISIPGGASCNFTMSFHPSSIGTFPSFFTVTSNNATSPDICDITGTGIAAPQAVITLSTTTFNFGVVSQGLTSRLNLTVGNSGSALLSISAQVLANVNDITVDPTSTCTVGVNLNSFQSCIYVFNFTPASIENITNTFTITTNAVNGPTNIFLQGTSVASQSPTLGGQAVLGGASVLQ